MKPEIGTRVYCVYDECILVEKVEFIGSESFIISSFGSATYEDSWEWYYEEYDRNWFTDLEKAKEELLSRFVEDYDGNLVIVKKCDAYYQLEDADEE